MISGTSKDPTFVPPINPQPTVSEQAAQRVRRAASRIAPAALPCRVRSRRLITCPIVLGDHLTTARLMARLTALTAGLTARLTAGQPRPGAGQPRAAPIGPNTPRKAAAEDMLPLVLERQNYLRYPSGPRMRGNSVILSSSWNL